MLLIPSPDSITMRHFSRVLASAAVLVAAAPQTAVAQAAPIVGTWNIEWEFGRQFTSGGSTALIAKGTMAVSASGDSLLAVVTMTSRGDGGTPRPPVTFGGRRTDKGATFVQRSVSIVNVNGDEQKQESTATWTLTATGDMLSGDIARSIPGMVEGMPAAPIKGTRAKP
jgi:hypothetical protein